MHIPDNYLSPSTDGVLVAAMVPVWVHCARAVARSLDRRHTAFLGVAAAFSFLLMMFNVPVPGGTTAHAVGGTLVALLLGPEAACVAVSVALAIQALVFGDGGVLAFGANCLNMAFVLPFVGYGTYRLVAARVTSDAGRRAAMAVGSWLGINAAALCAGVEFGIQPLLFRDAAGQALYCPYPLAVSVPAMLIPHMLVAGVVEAATTVAVYEFVRRTSPGYIVSADVGAGRTSSLAPVAALLVVLAAATPLGLLARGDAWGEWAPGDLSSLVGYVPSGMEGGFSFEALVPDYSLAGLPDLVGYALSAVIGASLLVIAFKLLSERARPGAGGPPDA